MTREQLAYKLLWADENYCYSELQTDTLIKVAIVEPLKAVVITHDKVFVKDILCGQDIVVPLNQIRRVAHFHVE